MIATNIEKINEKIALAAEKSGRKKEEIQLVAVSKRFPANKILEAHHCGHTLFGENYIQEAQQKKAELPDSVKLHFIGHLQSNKAKIAAEIFDMIETVDRIKLAKVLNKQRALTGQKLPILIQVNIGNDPKKSGSTAEETERLAEQILELPYLKLSGLMTMPPIEADPELSRPHFAALRILADRLHEKGLFPEVTFPEISMGMSSDFHIAIEEGASIVRVGTAIFGERQPL